jgi:DNA-binding MarR family transcriptional regulator
MSELAERVSSSPSRISHAVDRLAERGWVRRERSETDRRGNLAVLTEEGMAVVERAAPRHVRAVRENLFDLLTREQLAVLDEVFSAVLGRLDGTASKGRAAPPCPP